MSPNELLELFRTQVDDLAKPYLWSDKEFLVYLNDAQDTFVRAIGGIADRRSSLTRISYKAGDQFKKHDPRILRIRGAFDQDNRVIKVKNLDNFETGYLEDDYGISIHTGLDDTRTGPLQCIINDVDADELQLFPIPEEDGYIQLFVYRRPLTEITSCDDTLEIPSQHHLKLLDWVKYRAYMKQDVETFDTSAATEFRMVFMEGVADAKKEKAWREDRKRTVAYGGL